ncbi:hypothetical protein N7492_004465 [Penicillium capsulatum]|uniref:Uncharacterized protein n=1 Tax=Penicillium capsulatum TaxID=69766 RepID=A0A9W9IDX6_9EURO|nr:hypothetical protein N7492_004465 [Penicillium capsulatum]KAJ6136415.1 hypothetical protein N7512_001575 [Penicillium capsulatum]
MPSTIVLITGANSGIGYTTTKVIASNPNYHVIMASRDPAKGQEALTTLQSEGIRGTLSTIQLDVDDDASISAAVDTVTKDFDRVDIFISNAGITAYDSTGRERLQRIFSTNVFGAMLVTEAFIPLLLNSARPYMIQISSETGSLAAASDPQNEWYALPFEEYRMSKAALDMMAIQWHKRLHAQNVRVYAFCPGLVRTKVRGPSEEAFTGNGNAKDPMESALGIWDIVSGKRDADAGKFLNKDGLLPW